MCGIRKSAGNEGVQSRGGVVVVVVVGMVVVVVGIVEVVVGAAAVVVEGDSVGGDPEESPASEAVPAAVVKDREVASAVGGVDAVGRTSSETAVLEQDTSTTRPTTTARNGPREAASPIIGQ